MSETDGILSAPFALHKLGKGRVDVVVEASEPERAALAIALGLPSIAALCGRFQIVPSGASIRVTGRVTARVEQTCVVSLDPFEVAVDEPVDLTFDPAAVRDGDAAAVVIDPDRDEPEPLTGDTLDLGAITAEFLALGLDPYPRKPGASFAETEASPVRDSPFAKLARFAPDGDAG